MSHEKKDTHDLRCPVCGSDNVNETTEQYQARYPYGGPITMPIAVHTCRACKMDGDFTGGNDAIINAAHRLARLSATRPLFDAMEMCGVTRPYFERVIGVPQGTVEEWCSGGCGPAEFALAWLIVQDTKVLDKMDAIRWWRHAE